MIIIKKPPLQLLVIRIEKNPVGNIRDLSARESAITRLIIEIPVPETAERSRSGDAAHEIRPPNLTSELIVVVVFQFVPDEEALDLPEAIALLHPYAAAAASPQEYDLLRRFDFLFTSGFGMRIVVLDEKRDPPDASDLHGAAGIAVGGGGDVGAGAGGEALLAAVGAD